VALLSENRETIGMALLRKGITDIKPGSQAREPGSVRPQGALRHLTIKGDDLQYQTVPEGSSWLTSRGRGT